MGQELVSRHEIVRMNGDERQLIKPNYRFPAQDEQEAEMLIKAGAARKATSGDKHLPAAQPAAQKGKAPKQQDPQAPVADADAVIAEVLSTEGADVVVRVGDVTFTTPKNTVREDGSLTKRGLEGFEAAQKAAAGDDGLV